MHQIVLADEINRTSPKTQSALLEVMQENQVTIDGSKTYPAPPLSWSWRPRTRWKWRGTYPLPEAQLDRFFMRISMGYPTHGEELEILHNHRSRQKAVKLQAVATAEDVLHMQQGLDRSCAPAGARLRRVHRGGHPVAR